MSVAVLTCVCNEEDLLPRWLSHYRFAERHVMVDSKTKDGTRELLEGCHVSEIHFPNLWCEETRTQRVMEWYRGLTTKYAIVTDVDEMVDPLDRLFWYTDNFPAGCDVVFGRAVNCVSMQKGVFATANPTKPVLMKTGVEGLQLSWACHQVYGTRNFLAMDVFMKHMCYEDYQIAHKRRMSRRGIAGGAHWLTDEAKFDLEWCKAHREAIWIEQSS